MGGFAVLMKRSDSVGIIPAAAPPIPTAGTGGGTAAPDGIGGPRPSPVGPARFGTNAESPVNIDSPISLS